MSAKLRKQWDRLQIIANAKSKKTRIELIKQFSSEIDFVVAIREICKNIVNRNIPLSPKQVRRLKEHKRDILYLTQRTVNTPAYRRRVNQVGGWLPIILPLVATVIGEIIRSRK